MKLYGCRDVKATRMKVEDFSPVCQAAIEKFRKDLVVKNLCNEFDKRFITYDCFFRSMLVHGYLIALGVSDDESYDAGKFIQEHNYWLDR